MSAVTERPDIPAMPLVLMPEAMRGLLPLRFGRGVRLEFHRYSGQSRLDVADPSGGRFERFTATPAGWIEAWETAAAWTRQTGFRRAVEIYTQRCGARSTPLRSAQTAVRLDGLMPLVLAGLIFLGGHGSGELLQPGIAVDLRKRPSGLVLVDVVDGTERFALADADLTGAEASGPGQVTSGGFVATVGHGLMGNLIDQAAAARMTERFGRTEIHTNVRITGTDCELFFRSTQDLPEQAQVALAAIRARVCGLAADWVPARPAPVSPVPQDAVPEDAAPEDAAREDAVPEDAVDDVGDDLVTKLERLARLRDSGALTDVEFQAAKDRLLS
jgi:hypothetical protein